MSGASTLMPMAGTAFVVAAAAGRHMHRFPARVPIGGRLFVIGLGCALLALSVHSSSGQSVIFAGFAVIGVGVGLTTPVLVLAAVEAVPPHRAGMAGGAVNTARQQG